MLIPMLKAVEKMLDDNPKDTLATRVVCARTIVSELIHSLELGSQSEKKEKLLIKDPKPEEVSLPEEETVPEVKDGLYQAVVDVDQKLTGIKGLDLEAIIEVDGKKIKHKDAIGKSFSKIKLPE
jgi:hypothetical protein